MKEKKVIVISAINIFEGGALSILKDCLGVLDQDFFSEYRVIALVHDKSLFDFPTIEFITYPKSRSSYFYRFYYEYIYFWRLSKKLNPELWFSLHDMTPNVVAKKRAVYCHNPSPFYKTKLKDFRYSPSVALFSLFYRYLYRINIHKNDYIVTQQTWMANAFIKRYKVSSLKFIVAKPFIDTNRTVVTKDIDVERSEEFGFFYPAYPRIFKNFEIICQAVKKLNVAKTSSFKVYLTIDGSENSYAKMIVDKYSHVANIVFLGLLKREEVEDYYSKTDALIFPSKLETWGLPISEFSDYNKPILLADLPYAHETSSRSPKIAFFNPDDANQLADQMQLLINHQNDILQSGLEIKSTFKETSSWNALFNALIEN